MKKMNSKAIELCAMRMEIYSRMLKEIMVDNHGILNPIEENRFKMVLSHLEEEIILMDDIINEEIAIGA